MVELQSVVDIAHAAGAAILDVYERDGDVAVAHKADSSPLTEADAAAHELIVRALARLSPTVPIVSEEDGGGEPRSESSAWDGTYWLVDPLDGTKEFIKRTGEFTVNIALVRDGVPVLGVVYAPVLRTTWTGHDGVAERHDASGVTRIRVTVPALLDSTRVVASRDHAGAAVQALLARLPGATTVSMGSSLKFCLVAEGRADLYYRDGPTMPWDTAAAHAVLAAAGGEVYAETGAPLRYLSPRTLNPHFLAVGDLLFPWASLLSPSATP
jgi:3'(2'), 5'-bisphosphate nucleotidase